MRAFPCVIKTKHKDHIGPYGLSNICCDWAINLIAEKVREKPVPVSSKPVEEKKQPIPVDDLEKLLRLKSAVGMIYGYGQTGTAFRVGADKIITAWHVVRAISRMYNYMYQKITCTSINKLNFLRDDNSNSFLQL